MAAWLGFSGMFDSKEEHEGCLPFLIWEERDRARQELVAVPNGDLLAAMERPRREGEGAEPMGLA